MGKFQTGKRARRDDDDSEEAQPSKKPTTSKKSKTAAPGPGESGRDADGNPFWPLSNTRRVGLSEFKGKMLVNIREYYTDASGDLKPGKKGISLPLEQYAALVNAVPEINASLSEQGHEAPELSAPAAPPKQPKKEKETAAAKPKPKKSNIDATSDEEDEDDEE